MFKVAEKFKLKRNTIHLAVQYLDSFLEHPSSTEK